MKAGVMEYEANKLKELSAYLGEKKWFAGDSVSQYHALYLSVCVCVCVCVCVDMCIPPLYR